MIKIQEDGDGDTASRPRGSDTLIDLIIFRSIDRLYPLFRQIFI